MRTSTLLLGLALMSTVTLGGQSGERPAGVRSMRDQLQAAERAVEDRRYADAADIYAAVLARVELPGKPPLLEARALDGLGDVRRLEGRHADAVALYLRSTELWERLLGPDQPRLATTLHNLGVVRLAQGLPEAAAPLFQRAATIWERSLGPDSPEAAASRRALQTCSP